MSVSPAVLGALIGACIGLLGTTLLQWLECRRFRSKLEELERGRDDAATRIARAIREYEERYPSDPSDPASRAARSYELSLHIDVRRKSELPVEVE